MTIVKAFATKMGCPDSDVVEQAFDVLEGRVEPIIFKPTCTTLAAPARIGMRCATDRAILYVTQNGTEPSEESARYQNDDVVVFSEAGEYVLKAKAFKQGFAPSATASMKLKVVADMMADFRNTSGQMPLSNPSPWAALIHDGYEMVNRLFYDTAQHCWVQSVRPVKIGQRIGQGGMREAFDLIDLAKPEGKNRFVAKLYKSAVKADVYFEDARMQSFCQMVADHFNARGVPKRVQYLNAYVIQRLEVSGKPVMACERFLSGEYKKYNNNAGYIAGIDDDRNTPQVLPLFAMEVNVSFDRFDIPGVLALLICVHPTQKPHCERPKRQYDIFLDGNSWALFCSAQHYTIASPTPPSRLSFSPLCFPEVALSVF